MIRWRLLVLSMMLAAACTPQAAPQPTSDALLVGGYLPKMIVTIDMTAVLAASPTADISPTPSETPFPQGTVAALFPTATPTPYIGVFLGQPTSEGPDSQTPLAPLVLVPTANSPPLRPAADCAIPVAEAFQNAYRSNTGLQAFGCPRDTGAAIGLITQRFERGRMFWRDTRQIIITTDSSAYWRVVDTWNEGMPIDDPNLSPPEGASQPIRGFGMVWRGNEAIRTALGWALGPEIPIASVWQEFDGGSLFLGDSSLIYAVPYSDTGQFTGGIAQ